MAGFDSVLGNELVRMQLRSAIRKGAFGQAYLLLGEKGIGKHTLTEAMLLELYCEAEDVQQRPCCQCPSCKKILSHNHPDVIYVTPTTRTGISVDDVREQVNQEAAVRPYLGGRKVFVIGDADKMTQQAQNALLKTLEEPPAYVSFILMAGDESAMLQTILSRVQRLKLRPLEEDLVLDLLKERSGGDDGMLRITAAFSRGILGRAIELYESESFRNWYRRATKLLKELRNLPATAIVREAGLIREECEDLSDLLDMMSMWYRDVLYLKQGGNAAGLVLKEERNAIREQAAYASIDGLLEIQKFIEICRVGRKANVNPELALEILLFNIKENQNI